jgi:large subunit ribosomal protein L18
MVKKIKGTPNRPRLNVFRSHQHIYAQVIDDSKSITLFSCSSLDPELKTDLKKGQNCESAKLVGEKLGKLLLENNVKKVVFDRGQKRYHGRIKALAEGVRSVGLDF